MEQNKTNNEALLIKTYSHAVNTIKVAILNAQYEAARGVNSIQLMLYYGIGRYLSYNTRQGRWGTDAIGTISRMLKTDMPGLRGYSETSLKRMRIFYEAWAELDSGVPIDNSSIRMDELRKDIQSGEQEPVSNRLVFRPLKRTKFGFCHSTFLQ